MGDDKRKITVRTAARMMGKSEQFLRIGLQNNRFPFGSAVKLTTKWSYYISPQLFFQYIGKNQEQEKAQSKTDLNFYAGA